MEKQNLIQFIKKYNLGGLVESVSCRIMKDKTLKTEFMLSDNTLKGEIILKDFRSKPDNADLFSIYNTEKLLKLLTILDDDIAVLFNETNKKIVGLKITDSKINIKYMLAENSIIPKVRELTNIPEFELKFQLSDYVIDKFLKSVSALSEAETFFIESNGIDILNLIITDDNNKINIILDNIDYRDKKTFPRFKINKFKEILLNNKECDNRLIEISSKGIMKLFFENNIHLSEYYMVANSL